MFCLDSLVGCFGRVQHQCTHTMLDKCIYTSILYQPHTFFSVLLVQLLHFIATVGRFCVAQCFFYANLLFSVSSSIFHHTLHKNGDDDGQPHPANRRNVTFTYESWELLENEERIKLNQIALACE